MVDVVASNAAAMERYLDFTLAITDASILVDSTSREVDRSQRSLEAIHQLLCPIHLERIAWKTYFSVRPAGRTRSGLVLSTEQQKRGCPPSIHRSKACIRRFRECFYFNQLWNTRVTSWRWKRRLLLPASAAKESC